MRSLLRLTTALYLSAFLLGSSAAPHRHNNAVEDLLEGRSSDSGDIFTSDAATQDPRPSLSSLRLIDDDPCPACFPNDFASDFRTPRPSLPPPGSCPRLRAPSVSTASAARSRFVASRAPPAAT